MAVNPGGPGPEGPDDRDLDDGGLDLTPRDHAVAGRRSSSRRWVGLGVLVALVVAVGFVIVQARGATMYYRNADEAVAQREELIGKTFRLQGVVVGDTVKVSEAGPGRFTVAYNGVEVKVVNTGKEPALFKAGMPVVLEGRWSETGPEFASSRILVKHTEDYTAKDDGSYDEEHPDRTVPENESDES